jgi:sortase A
VSVEWSTGRAGTLKAMAMAAFAAGLVCLASGLWIPLKAQMAQVLIEAAWQRERTSLRAQAPWPWADTRPLAKLTWGDGRGSATLFVLEGSSGRNLAFGPVHDAASVVPGARGNSIIEGHRDTHFALLRDAKPGVRLSVELLDGTRSEFVVTDVRVVDSRRSRILLDADSPRLSLVTCYPFNAVNPGGPLRWLVTAERVQARHI